MIAFLEAEGVDRELLERVVRFREKYPVPEKDRARIPKAPFRYYGREVWEAAIRTLLAGENLLLVGPKATGKNVLAQGLAELFGRPEWDVAFYVQADTSTLIGADTFRGGEVVFREGPVLACARAGGFGVLDEINMARNESLSVLHQALDFRRGIDVPGYGRAESHEACRFIATMNYGYAGTRELNEALASRFMVLEMPLIGEENLRKLLRDVCPGIREEALLQFSALFEEIRSKCEGGEISQRALDLRGLIAAVRMISEGMRAKEALTMGLAGKCFDPYERKLAADILDARIPDIYGYDEVFGGN